MVPRNCLSLALDRWHESGGWLGCRRSKYWTVGHVVYVSPEGRIESYVPPGELAHPLQALVGFEAELREFDPPELARPIPISGIVWSAWLFALGATGWGVSRAWRNYRNG